MFERDIWQKLIARVIPNHRDHKSRKPVIELMIYIGTIVKKKIYDFGIALKHCQNKSRIAAAIAYVYIDQVSQRLHFAQIRLVASIQELERTRL